MTHVCAWCNPEPGDDQTTHGICNLHFIKVHNRPNRRFWLLSELDQFFVLDRMTGNRLPYDNLESAADEAFQLETRWMEAA
jgi:hypothetical protein